MATGLFPTCFLQNAGGLGFERPETRTAKTAPHPTKLNLRHLGPVSIQQRYFLPTRLMEYSAYATHVLKTNFLYVTHARSNDLAERLSVIRKLHKISLIVRNGILSGKSRMAEAVA